MGVRVKKTRRGTSYHRLLVESRNERGVHTHLIGKNPNMCLNPLKHLIKAEPYKNVECQKLLAETLNTYRAYMESIQKEGASE